MLVAILTRVNWRNWTNCPLSSVVIPALDGASADRLFAFAYNAAALEAAKTAIACASYRVAGAGHHRVSFDVVKLANGKAADPFSDLLRPMPPEAECHRL
jgi:hypothetical protein